MEKARRSSRSAARRSSWSRCSEATGISGIWCAPACNPATKCPMAYGASTSPVAGKFICTRTSITGSSLPVYLPAMLCSREVLTARRLLAGGARPDRLDHVPLVVAQQRRDVVEVLRGVQLDHAGRRPCAVHVHDHEAEALGHLRREDAGRRCSSGRRTRGRAAGCRRPGRSCRPRRTGTARWAAPRTPSPPRPGPSRSRCRKRRP